MRTFSTVLIPADGAAMEEQTVSYTAETEVGCLMEHCKGRFAAATTTAAGRGGGSGPQEAIRQQVRAQLAEATQKQGAAPGTPVDETTVQMLMNSMGQLVDVVMLMPNSKLADFVGVSLYVDDRGQAKQLPVNARACGLAAACGLQVQVRGDAFVARLRDNDDDFERLDFGMADCSSTAAWVRQACEFNRRRGAGGEAAALEKLKLDAAAAKKPELTGWQLDKRRGNEAFVR